MHSFSGTTVFCRLFSLRKSEFEQFLLFRSEKIHFARKNLPSEKPALSRDKEMFTCTVEPR